MTGKTALVPVGISSKPHGIRGTILFKPFNKSTETLSKGKWLFTGDGSGFLIREARKIAEGVFIVGFEGIEERGAAERFRNVMFYCRRSDLREPASGEYYCCDLIGLEVRDSGGKRWGSVKEVLRTNMDILQVVDDRREYLIPMIEGAVLEISRKGIVVDPEYLV